MADKAFKEPKEVREPKAKKCECTCKGSRDTQCCKHGDYDYLC